MPSASMLKNFVSQSNGTQEMLEGKPYDPNADYYSIDWHCKKEIRWVRNSFTTLEDFWMRYAVSGISKSESIFETAKDFRVLPETFLTQPRKHWNEEIKSYVPDFITNRQFIFDNRYEDFAVLTTLEQSLSQLTADKETPEEWVERIKADPRMRKKFLKKEEAENGFAGEYSHLSFENGKWVSDKEEKK